jgi:hypothetical protein
MKKKTAVILLTLLFFVSTTGIPLTINLCSLMDTPDADMCEMHSKSNTCEPGFHHSSVKNQIEEAACCKTELVDKSICDEYLQASIQKQNLNSNIIAVINIDLVLINNSLINSVKYFSNTSPPSLINNNIYLNNSILLI